MKSPHASVKAVIDAARRDSGMRPGPRCTAPAWKQARNEGGEEARRADEEGETKPRGQVGIGSKAGASTGLCIGRAKTIPMGLAGSSRARAARGRSQVRRVCVWLVFNPYSTGHGNKRRAGQSE